MHTFSHISTSSNKRHILFLFHFTHVLPMECRHYRYHTPRRLASFPRYQGSWGQHGAHLGPVGPRWAPCWSHKPCYQGCPSRCFMHVLPMESRHCKYHHPHRLSSFVLPAVCGPGVGDRSPPCHLSYGPIPRAALLQGHTPLTIQHHARR